jgi:hypothetical protein
MATIGNVTFVATGVTGTQITNLKTLQEGIAVNSRRFAMTVDGFDGDILDAAITYTVTFTGSGEWDATAISQHGDILDVLTA